MYLVSELERPGMRKMQKIINGKKYDTETAEEIGEGYYSNPNDFHYFAETLYRKRTGEYFLYGEGGPASRYAVAAGQNSWMGGEKIIPLTIESAKEWAEKYLGADAYEDEFGEIDDTGEKNAVSISLTATAHNALRQEALKKNTSMSALIEEFALSLKK